MPRTITLAKLLSVLLLCCFIVQQASWAIGQQRYVETEYQSGDFVLARAGGAAPIYVDANDFPGVIRAANNLSQDILKVTGFVPAVLLDESALHSPAVIIGTLGKSALVDRLIRDRKIDAAAIQGKWESYLVQTVSQPIPGISSALIIAGSDKRGTIYGIYEIAEQIGVSPWYWCGCAHSPPRGPFR